MHDAAGPIKAALPADLREFAQFGFSTGWRKGEIASLDWSNVQGDMIRLRPDHAKNRHGRSVPIVGAPVDVIERRQKARQVEVDGTARLVDVALHRDGQPVGDFRKRGPKRARRRVSLTASFTICAGLRLRR
jgi:integrase